MNDHQTIAPLFAQGAESMEKVKTERGRKRREMILEAAGKCFLENGFSGTSIASIVKEAQISPGHLYHFFSSKEEVIQAMAEAQMDALTEHLGSNLEDLDGSPSVLANLVCDPLRHGPLQQSLLLELLAESGRSPELARIIQAHSARLSTLIASILGDDPNIPDADQETHKSLRAYILLALMDGMRSLRLRNPGMDVDEVHKIVAKLVAV